MNDSNPPSSSNSDTGSAVLDRAIGALKAGAAPDSPPPLVAERTLAALWAAEVRSERARSRWVMRVAAVVVLGVCAAATSAVLAEPHRALAAVHPAQAPHDIQPPPPKDVRVVPERRT